MMTPTNLSIESLVLVTGGQQQAAPAPARRELTDAELEDRRKDKEELRAWELKNPFSRFLCQGDVDCLRDGGAPGGDR